MAFEEPPRVRLVIEGKGPSPRRHLLLHNLCLPVLCLNLLLFDLRWVVEEIGPARGRCPPNRPSPACDLIVGKQTVYRMWSGSRHPRRGHACCGVLLGETQPLHDCCNDIVANVPQCECNWFKSCGFGSERHFYTVIFVKLFIHRPIINSDLHPKRCIAI